MPQHKKIRLDDLLIQRGFFNTREQVLPAVLAREVRVDDVYPTSAAIKVSPDAELLVKGRRAFVSRGGYKLEGAITGFNIDVSGMRCLDVGSSTGGFTDCLLQHGAASVTCVDVNYGQLAWKLRESEQVFVFERTNIKEVSPDTLGAPFDCIVIDVSFIGLAHLAVYLARFATTDTVLIALVKPQFESLPGEAERGVVHDETVRLRTVDEVRAALLSAGFSTQGVLESPITGPAGNVEYLIYARFA